MSGVGEAYKTSEGVTYQCGGATHCHLAPCCAGMVYVATLWARADRGCLPSTDCGQDNQLKPGDHVQCRECGYRILYKKRTKRSASTNRLRCRAVFFCCTYCETASLLVLP